MPLTPLLLALVACQGEAPSAPEPEALVAPAAAPGAPRLRRLTADQLRTALGALFGEDLLMPGRLEPDQEVDGLVAVGQATAALSALGVEQLEDAAFLVAGQVVEDPERLAALLPCDAEADPAEVCLRALAEDLGLRAWRRPLSPEEVEALVAVGLGAHEVLGGVAEGARFLIAALLQSPNFVYRVELGEPDPEHPGLRRLDAWELASRLSFTLWDAPPDDALLALAAEGTLTDPEVLAAEAERMLDDPRALRGMRAFFTDKLDLDQLDGLRKDPYVFPFYSEALGEAAREETLLGIDRLYLEGLHHAALLTERTTYVDRRLASIYGVAAPSREGHGEVELPADGPRAGLLGQVSFLALQAHAVSSSATLRGVFVREVLLCQPMAPPPADVDASIPEPSADAPTLRERLAVHLEVESCAGCHVLMDPIGLGFEQFDGLGGFRATENGHPIDPSGSLDGQAFADARGLGRAIAGHPRLGPCLTETAYRWTLGHDIEEAEEPMVEFLAASLEAEGGSLRSLMRLIVTNPHFMLVGEVVP